MNSELSGRDDAEEARLVNLDGGGLKELVLFNGRQTMAKALSQITHTD